MSGVRGWCPDLFAPMMSGDGLLLRIKPRLARLPATAAIPLSQLSLRHGNGRIELTNRGNLQFRGFTQASAEAFADAALSLGLADADHAAEKRRNILVSPLAADDPDCAADTVEIALTLQAALSDPAFAHLPDKFGLLVDGGGLLPLDGVAADIALRYGADGWRVEAGGAVLRCTAAQAAGIALQLALLTPPGRRLSRDPAEGMSVFAAAGHDATPLDRHPAPVIGLRFPPGRDRAATPGRNASATDVGDPSAASGGDPSAPPDIDPPAPGSPAPAGGSRSAPPPDVRRASRDFAWFPSSGSDAERSALPPVAVGPIGRSLFGIGAPPGQFDATSLRMVAELSGRVGDGVLRVTPFRSIVVGGLDLTGLRAVRSLLSGLAVDPDDARLRTASCIGRPGCAHATVAAPADAARLATLVPVGALLHVSGCAKGCGHPGAASIVLVGRDGRYDLVRDGRAGDSPVLSGIAAADAAGVIGSLPA